MTESTEPATTLLASRPAASSNLRTKIFASLLLLLAASLAARHLYRSPHAASDLRITPDEVEYAVCARRLATLGRFDLDIDGVSTPAQSTPWFSALLAPVYYVAPQEIGNGIWVVFALALVGVLVIQRIGTMVAGPLGGALAVIGLLAQLPYVYTARSIMTDAPAMVLAFVGLWLFLRWPGRPSRVRESLIAGLLIASAFALRSVYLSMLAPFAWRALRAHERRGAHLAVLLAPVVIVVLANAGYNQATFGDWQRTGYQYWCPVPYDYPDLVLSPTNFAANFATLTTPVAAWAFAFGAIGLITLALRRPPGWDKLLAYSAVTALPISALHLFYFFPDLRFHVYLFALCAVLGGIGLASVLPIRWRAHNVTNVAAVAALSIALIAMPPFGIQLPLRRRAADVVHNSTPDDAVIISGLEPVYLAACAPPESRRTYLAASREVEYASKVLVSQRVERELTLEPGSNRPTYKGLLAHGGRWAVAHTADEMHGQIEDWVRAGRAVFLETSFLTNPVAVQRMLGGTLRLEAPRARLTRVIAAS